MRLASLFFFFKILLKIKQEKKIRKKPILACNIVWLSSLKAGGNRVKKEEKVFLYCFFENRKTLERKKPENCPTKASVDQRKRSRFSAELQRRKKKKRDPKTHTHTTEVHKPHLTRLHKEPRSCLKGDSDLQKAFPTICLNTTLKTAHNPWHNTPNLGLAHLKYPT